MTYFTPSTWLPSYENRESTVPVLSCVCAAAYEFPRNISAVVTAHSRLQTADSRGGMLKDDVVMAPVRTKGRKDLFLATGKYG